MKIRRSILQYTLICFLIVATTGCSLGVLLFYKETSTASIFKSSTSKKNYYTIKATTLSHCGCTYLRVDNYVKGKKTFHMYYNYNNQTGKTIYSIDPQTGRKDTINLIATTANSFTIPFDSLDNEIFKQMDTIIINKPKEIIYPITRQDYKGFNKKPAYY